MITAVDSSVLFDVLLGDPKHGPRSAATLRQARNEGRLIGCEIVWAEVVAAYQEPDQALDSLTKLAVEFESIDGHAAARAGTAWRRYRRAGGSRQRLVADFLIGAHAAASADRLLTRDRGFYRNYFEELAVLDPSRV